MSDRIELRGPRVLAVCGVLPEEKVRRQPLDLDVYADLTAALTTDDLADTMDYGTPCALVAGSAARESFDLRQRFAGRVAEDVLATSGVETVAVWKLRPPVPEDLATSGVRIHRTA